MPVIEKKKGNERKKTRREEESEPTRCEEIKSRMRDSKNAVEIIGIKVILCWIIHGFDFSSFPLSSFSSFSFLPLSLKKDSSLFILVKNGHDCEMLRVWREDEGTHPNLALSSFCLSPMSCHPHCQDQDW